MIAAQREMWHTISKCAALTLRDVAIRAFAFKGRLDLSDTPLQMIFSNEQVLVLDGDSDGESLRATDEPWIDPFVGQQTAENQSFVEDYGKWTLVDYSHEANFTDVVGETLTNVLPLFNKFDKLCGVVFNFPTKTLVFFVAFDECKIMWEITNEVLEKNDLKLDN